MVLWYHLWWADGAPATKIINKNDNLNNNNNNFTPAAVYENAYITKSQILSENKGKSGIYLWRNLINGKTYIGSAVNLKSRMNHYFSLKHLVINNTMAICRAASQKKHGRACALVLALRYLNIVSGRPCRAKPPTFNIKKDLMVT